MDVAGINPGIDFARPSTTSGHLRRAAGHDRPRLDQHRGSSGTRRLDDPNDFVRLEVASALARNIAVIPVLVHDAKMPHPDQLPDNLKTWPIATAWRLPMRAGTPTCNY